ncbi:hypothetical protein [Speluncibacter jeojiensis]|uniref:BACON domain-containing protein n=1 Tax=Speluncibacter jeojiensis TaxID=2710754 RepID=A0A9X4REB2_9ACTN|nr:hypothetical protein [Corynebacteriales bacterium D3-21]
MRTLVRGAGCCVTAAVVAVLSATVAAAVTVPFQVQPASFGNPHGSFDVPPTHCAAEVGGASGAVTITGTLPDRWGCLIQSDVHWLNLSTGATGTARLSDGLNGHPPEATLPTGPGRVVAVLVPLPGTTTPGLVTVDVP